MTTNHPYITFLKHEGGFLDGAYFRFKRGYTVLIGGTGTGKSTNVEAIPNAIDQAPTTVRADRIASLRKKNYAGATITLGYETAHGAKYTVVKEAGKPARLVNDAGKVLPNTPASVIKFAYYGQNEFDTLGDDGAAHLALLDRFVEGDLTAFDTETRRLLRDLEAKAGEIARLEKEMVDLEQAIAGGHAVEETLRAVQAAPAGMDPVVAQRAHAQKLLRERERLTLDAVSRDNTWLRGEATRLMTDGRRRMAASVDAEVLNGPNGDVLAPVGDELRKTVDQLEQLVTKLAKQSQATDATLTTAKSALAQRHHEQDEAYRALLAQTQEEASRVAERTKAQQQYAAIVEQKRSLAQKKLDWQRRRDERKKLFSELSAQDKEVLRLRKEAAKSLTDQLIDIEIHVEEHANRAGVHSLLTEMFVNVRIGDATGPVLKEIARKLRPEALVACVEADDMGPLIDRIAGLTVGMANRVLETIRKSGRLYELEAVRMPDLVDITLKHGKELKRLKDLSSGQRAGVFLMITMLQGDWPIIIDQPEDHLDASFVADILVKMIRAKKIQRQFIFVSHNGTVVIVAEADHVFVMGFNGEHGVITEEGTIDETRDSVLRWVDGGPVAFLTRKERYGY